MDKMSSGPSKEGPHRNRQPLSEVHPSPLNWRPGQVPAQKDNRGKEPRERREGAIQEAKENQVMRHSHRGQQKAAIERQATTRLDAALRHGRQPPQLETPASRDVPPHPMQIGNLQPHYHQSSLASANVPSIAHTSSQYHGIPPRAEPLTGPSSSWVPASVPPTLLGNRPTPDGFSAHPSPSRATSRLFTPHKKAHKHTDPSDHRHHSGHARPAGGSPRHLLPHTSFSQNAGVEAGSSSRYQYSLPPEITEYKSEAFSAYSSTPLHRKKLAGTAGRSPGDTKSRLSSRLDSQELDLFALERQHPSNEWARLQDADSAEQRLRAQEDIRKLLRMPETEIPPEERVNTPIQMSCKLMEHQKVALQWLKDQENDRHKRGGLLAGKLSE